MNKENKEKILWNDKNDSNKEKKSNDKETVYVEQHKKDLKKEKEKNKVKKNSKWRKFFYGVGKEFGRVTWSHKKEVGTNFAIVLAVILFFALIFTGISLLMAII